MDFNLFDQRKDITQQNFLKFVKDANSTNELFGFNSNGILFLSNDERLYNLLQIYQFQRMGNSPVQTLKKLNLSKLQGKFLNKKYTNSVYYKQDDYIDPENKEEIVGTKTIIFTDDPEKLKEFTTYIIKFYAALCRVLYNSLCLEPEHEPACSLLPKMKYFITVNNEISNVAFDNQANSLKNGQVFRKNTVGNYENMNLEIAQINELITLLISKIKLA